MENKSKLKQHIFHLIIITISGALIYELPYFRSYYYDTYLEAYNLTNTQMGTFGSIYGLFGMVSYLIGGVVADIISTRKLMAGSLVLTGICGFVHLMHPNYVILLCIYAIWGCTTLFSFWPALVKSLKLISGKDEQSKAFGFLDGGRGLQYALDAVIMVAIFAYFSNKSGDIAGLNGIIAYFSGMCIILGILLFFLLRGLQPEGEEEAVESSKITAADVAKVVKMPSVWLMSLILLCTYTMNVSFYYFTPYSTSKFGMAAGAAAIITMCAQYIRPVAAFGGGAIADKWGRSNVMKVTFTMMLIPTLAIILAGNLSSVPFIALCIVIYLGMYGGYMICFSMMDEGNVPENLSGTASGLISTIGFTPDIFIPLVAGICLDKFGEVGYRYLFILIACFMVLGLVVVFTWDVYKKKVLIPAKAAEAAAVEE